MTDSIFGKYVNTDLDIENVSKTISDKLQTKTGISTLQNMLETPSSNINELKNRQVIPLLFKKLSKSNNTVLSNIQNQLEIFKLNESVFENIQNLNEENITQVLWNDKTPFGHYANQSSTILEAFHNWRTLFIPGSTIIAPILAILIPFAILQVLDKKPDVNEYLTIIQKTVRSTINIPSLFKSKNENDRIGFLFESLYIGMTIVFFMSGLYNTFSNAVHLRNIGNEMKEFSNQITNLINCLKSLNESFKIIEKKYNYRLLTNETTKILNDLNDFSNKSGLGLFGTFYLKQSLLNDLCQFVGKLDLYNAISQLENINFTYYIDSKTPFITMKQIYHPLLSNPVKNDFISTNNIPSNSLLTGPNRGGKSTFLKTFGLNVYLSQTLGFVFGSYCKMTPFELFETALSPVDCLGRLSLFESEIEFAKSILNSNKRPRLIIMDEIFHSTNANDGYEASKIFLSQLYKQEHILSLISTHYHNLTEDFKDCMKPLQAYSEKIGDIVKYSYKIQEGVSTVSSVLEILKEHNLINPLASN